jgi:hypothetical protein
MTAIINGSSPTVTFSDGTTQATSAIVSGYVPYANLPTGSVLQVVNNSSVASLNTTSTSFVATAVTITITPKFSNSKIYITAGGTLYGQTTYATLYRNSTNLGATNGFVSTNAAYVDSCFLSFLDSPATTNATTYTVYVASSGGSVYWNINNQTCPITVMEIAG